MAPHQRTHSASTAWRGRGRAGVTLGAWGCHGEGHVHLGLGPRSSVHQAPTGGGHGAFQDGQRASKAQVARLLGRSPGQTSNPRGPEHQSDGGASSRLLISRLTSYLAPVGQGPCETLKYSCLRGPPAVWNHVHLYLPGFTGSNQRGTLISVKFKSPFPQPHGAQQQ